MYSAAGERAQSEPTPHRGRRNRYYISPLLSVQILTVKIGKKTLCIRAFVYLLTYKGICEVDSCKLHQGGLLSGLPSEISAYCQFYCQFLLLPSGLA